MKPLGTAAETTTTIIPCIVVVVVAQLVEWLLTTIEVCSFNPIIRKIYIERFLSTTLNCRKYRKRGRDWPISQQNHSFHLFNHFFIFIFNKQYFPKEHCPTPTS